MTLPGSSLQNSLNDPPVNHQTPNRLNPWQDICERIIQNFQPRSVLVMGSSLGGLVTEFRQLNVEAWGVDTFEETIQNLPPEIQPYCYSGSFSESFHQDVDLITCLDGLDNLTAEQAEKIIENICRHSKECMFAYPFMEIQPKNFLSIEDWVELFARFNFVRNPDLTLSFSNKTVIRFCKVNQTSSQIIAAYENQLWRMQQENYSRREYEADQRHELIAKEQEIQNIFNNIEYFGNSYPEMIEKIKDLAKIIREQAQSLAIINQFITDRDQTIQERDKLLPARQIVVENQNQIIQELDQVLNERKRILNIRDQEIKQLHQQIAERNQVVLNIFNSRSWRLVQIIQKTRETLIPLGSWREQKMFAFFRVISIWKNLGFAIFMRRVTEKLTRHAQNIRVYNLVNPHLSASTFSVESVSSPIVVPAHKKTVDIIVTVHNALEDVQGCLESILRYTALPYRIILIDDGSEPPTQNYLADFAQSQQATLTRNEEASGYTRAANQGLRQSNADYAILLNSDTIVTPKWLDRMVACGESNPHIGIVGPLSNTASWQSVPEIFNSAGDWTDNCIPDGMTINDMNALIIKSSGRLFPRLPFLNGFCLMIKRELIEQIGLLDEQTFGDGYGEENDYCIRTITADWELAVADDTYIYHAQSKSYSHERRKKLVERSDSALILKYGQNIISDGVYNCRYDRVIQGIRSRSQRAIANNLTITVGREHFEGKRLLFILPIADPGGGGHVIIQEAEAMRKMGVDVRFLNLNVNRTSFEQSFPDLLIPVIYVEAPRRAIGILYKFDAVIATVYHSVDWMESLTPEKIHPVRGYYIQDFEPDFFAANSPEHKAALRSYTQFPDLIRVTKTEWNRDIVKRKLGVDCSAIGLSLDVDLFRPRRRNDPDWPNRPLRIAAMIRPSTPRRQAALTMKVLREFERIHGKTIEIILFGCMPDDPEFLKLSTDFSWRHAGILTRPQLASLLNEVDIFVDFSAFQAMGLTAMEAMACGVAVIVPEEGGASSFARHGENALVVNTASEKECLFRLEELANGTDLRNRIQRQSIFDICQFSPENAALNILNVLFPKI